METVLSTSPSSSTDSVSTRTTADYRWQQFEKTTDRPSFINTFDNLPEGWVVLAAEELAHRKPHYLPQDKLQQHRMRQLPFYGWMEPETTFANGTAWPHQSRMSSGKRMDGRVTDDVMITANVDCTPCDANSQDTLVDDDDLVRDWKMEALTACDLPASDKGMQPKKRKGFLGKIKYFLTKILGRGNHKNVAAVRC